MYSRGIPATLHLNLFRFGTCESEIISLDNFLLNITLGSEGRNWTVFLGHKTHRNCVINPTVLRTAILENLSFRRKSQKSICGIRSLVNLSKRCIRKVKIHHV